MTLEQKKEARQEARERIGALLDELVSLIGPFSPGWADDRDEDENEEGTPEPSVGPAFVNHWGLSLEFVDSIGHTFTFTISDSVYNNVSNVGLYAKALFDYL